MQFLGPQYLPVSGCTAVHPVGSGSLLGTLSEVRKWSAFERAPTIRIPLWGKPFLCVRSREPPVLSQHRCMDNFLENLFRYRQMNVVICRVPSCTVPYPKAPAHHTLSNLCRRTRCSSNNWGKDG